MQKLLDLKLQEFAGAFLFGIPMLYTMEMWWIGKYAERWKLLIFLLLAYSVCALLNYFHLRKERGAVLNSFTRAVDALAVGALTSLVVLLVLNQANIRSSPDAVIGMIVIQAVPLSIGAAARSLLNVGDSQGREGEDNESSQNNVAQATLNDISATVAGSIFIGLPLAPTEEIQMLAAEMTPYHKVFVIFLTLAVTYAIVFEGGFNPRQHEPSQNQGLFQRPLTETIMAYIVALFISLLSLYLFDRVSVQDPLSYTISQMVVLGLPAAIGGAAGRLVM